MSTRVRAHSVVSKRTGLNIRNEYSPEIEFHVECAAWCFVVADPLSNGRRPQLGWEATDRCTNRGHRGRVPDTYRRFSGDNVGKNHYPAGADSNLRRPGELGTTEVGRIVMVWRMSQYEQ